MRSACQKNKSLQNIVTNISISLLRHTNVIPADKGFYEAGIEARVSIINNKLRMINYSFNCNERVVSWSSINAQIYNLNKNHNFF